MISRALLPLARGLLVAGLLLLARGGLGAEPPGESPTPDSARSAPAPTPITRPATVDPDGDIYRARHYHGVVPGLRDLIRPERFEKLRKRDLVSWTGFQPRKTFSRVFWQLTAPEPRFEVVATDDLTIEVRLPETRLYRRNNGRPLITAQFDTAVARVESRRQGKGTVFTIRLKRKTAFRHRFEAPFLYVDVDTPPKGS